MLNTSYKIGSACIANRIKRCLTQIIHTDQTGFIAGRFIGDNVRLAYDILKYAKNENKPGLLLQIDFEKAFDSLSWKFMDKVLRFFNFGTEIRQWVKIFYTEVKSCVIINGQASGWFNLGRGCRQGDPLSPYLFILCAEILALRLRQDKDVRGFLVNGNAHLISQYADDTLLFLDGTKQSFERVVFLILEYAKYSGLCMNFEKSKAIWIGNNINNNTKFMEHLPLEWNPKEFTILGIKFTADLSDIVGQNYCNKIKEMQQVINLWSKRNLTTIGKVTVFKSLVISKIIHLLICLPKPSKTYMKQIEKLQYDFIWDNKRAKINKVIAV